jgi:tRNA A37 threonylcarbamoyladenosine dehydratase
MSHADAIHGAVLDADYVARFGGIGRLFGHAAMERLHAAHVCVVGIGGVGSWVVEALARTGIGALTIVDADDVCVTNVNRQLPALTDTVGRPKVSVMAERVRGISPSCRVEARAEFYTKANSDELLAVPFDFVVDCVDRMSIKAHLIHECRRLGRRVLTCGSAGGRRDPSAVRASDLGIAGNDELLRQVRRQLRREYGWPVGRGGNPLAMGVPCVFTSERPIYPHHDGTCHADPEAGESLRMDCASGFGAATFITGVFGFVAASEVVRLLLSGDESP